MRLAHRLRRFQRQRLNAAGEAADGLMKAGASYQLGKRERPAAGVQVGDEAFGLAGAHAYGAHPPLAQPVALDNHPDVDGAFLERDEIQALLDQVGFTALAAGGGPNDRLCVWQRAADDSFGAPYL